MKSDLSLPKYFLSQSNGGIDIFQLIKWQYGYFLSQSNGSIDIFSANQMAVWIGYQITDEHTNIHHHSYYVKVLSIKQ